MRTEKQAFKTMTVGEKLEHIWEYYKLPIFGIVLALILIIYIIVKLVSPDPDSILNVVLVNASPMAVEGEDVFERYLTEHGYDKEEETITVNAVLHLDPNEASQSSAVGYQALTAMTVAGEIDLLGGDEAVFDLLSLGNGMMGLDTVLPQEVLERYQDSLYTVENPETGEKVTSGIWLPEGNPLEKDGYYLTGALVGIPYTSANQEMAKEMLLYLLGE